MSDEFFEHNFREFVFREFFKGFNKDVKEFCMLAGFKANTHCVMANDYGKNAGYGKFERAEAIA